MKNGLNQALIITAKPTLIGIIQSQLNKFLAQPSSYWKLDTEQFQQQQIETILRNCRKWEL